MLKPTSKELFFQALVIVLRTTPVDKISVRHILDVSGLSRQTFYKYFHDKYDLINQYFYEIFAGTYQRINDDYRSIYDFWLHTYRLLEMHQPLFRAASQSQDFNNLLQFTHRKSYAFFLRCYEERGRTISDVERELLDFYCFGVTHIIEKYVQGSTCYAPEIMAEILSTAVPVGLTDFFTHLFHDTDTSTR